MSAAPSVTSHTPNIPPPPPPGRRPDFFDRIGQFWQRVTEGLELQQLWAQFQTEARTGYRLYSRDVGSPESGTRRSWWQTAKSFFWAILMKLSPAKRVVLLIGLFLLLVP